MQDNDFFKDLSARLAALQPAMESARDELRTRIEQILKKAFAELDLLTREEFDAQAQSLERAQQRIAELEQVVTSLEQKLTELESAQG